MDLSSNFSNNTPLFKLHKLFLPRVIPVVLSCLLLFPVLKVTSQNSDATEICDHTETLIEQCEKLYDNGNIDSTFSLAYKALNTCNGLSHTLTGKLNNLCGNVSEDKGDYKNAMYYYDQAFNYFIEAQDLNGISNAVNNIGNIYYRWSYYDKAVYYHKQALQIRKLTNNSKGIASSFNNLGNIYYSWKKFDKALEQYNKALSLKKKLNDSTELANIQINAGSAYLGLGDLSEAENCYTIAAEITKKQKNIVLQTDCQINIGYIRFQQIRYAEAIAIYKNAFVVSSQNDLKLEELMSSKNLAEVYYACDSITPGDFYYEIAWKLAEENDIKEVLLDLMTMKMDRLEIEGKIPEAYQLLKQSKNLSDSIFNETSMLQINDLQSLEKAEKQLREIQIKNLQLNLREEEIWNLRQLMILISAILIIGISALIIIFKYREKKSQLNHIKQLHKSMQKALAAQMNPHFISNSLNSIQKFFLENDVDAASTYLNDFGSLIRTVLNSSMTELITFEEEIQILKLYTALEALRLNKKIELIIESDDEIELETYQIPPLLLQPVIENAIWHGIAHHKESGKINIHFSAEGRFVRCSITDNGIGRNQSKQLNIYKKLSGRKSYGLQLVQDRLRIMNSGKKEYMSMIVEDLFDGDVPSGTKVILFIPIL
jgi:tetratricopeptide (TPR) repeat protein